MIIRQMKKKKKIKNKKLKLNKKIETNFLKKKKK